MSAHFGEHLLLDGYGADPKLLFDEALVRACLTELCNLLEVLQLTEPFVTYTPDGTLKVPGGVTGIVVLAESHISIHTFPKRCFVSADVYTCQNGVDVDFVIDYFKKKFKLQEVETNFIKRGLNYPEHNLLQ